MRVNNEPEVFTPTLSLRKEIVTLLMAPIRGLCKGKMCFMAAAKSQIFKCKRERKFCAPNAMTATANVIETKGEPTELRHKKVYCLRLLDPPRK